MTEFDDQIVSTRRTIESAADTGLISGDVAAAAKQELDKLARAYNAEKQIVTEPKIVYTEADALGHINRDAKQPPVEPLDWKDNEIRLAKAETEKSEGVAMQAQPDDTWLRRDVLDLAIRAGNQFSVRGGAAIVTDAKLFLAFVKGEAK